MNFNEIEDALFCELIRQIIIVMHPARDRGKISDPEMFVPGDFVGGSSYYSNVGETIELLSFAEVINAEEELKYGATDLRLHCVNAGRFGITFEWLMERFLDTLGFFRNSKYGFFSPEPFERPPEFPALNDLLEQAGYLIPFEQRVLWDERMRCCIGSEHWGISSTAGKDARRELLRIFAEMPLHWRKRLTSPIAWHDDDRLTYDLEVDLSNHWYQGHWNETPVRGTREPVYKRMAMSQRAYHLLWLAQGQWTYDLRS